MEVKEVTKYEIRFDSVDERIDLIGVKNYTYLGRERVVCSSESVALLYVKEVVRRVQSLGLRSSGGDSFNEFVNVVSGVKDDIVTKLEDGRYLFNLRTPTRKTEKGFKIYSSAMEISIIPIKVYNIS